MFSYYVQLTCLVTYIVSVQYPLLLKSLVNPFCYMRSIEFSFLRFKNCVIGEICKLEYTSTYMRTSVICKSFFNYLSVMFQASVNQLFNQLSIISQSFDYHMSFIINHLPIMCQSSVNHLSVLNMEKRKFRLLSRFKIINCPCMHCVELR